jgi:CelD/BcsL family acetyltransferase involved in cellulose biosynthesis
LSHRGKACVVLYGFVTAGKFDLYQLGVTSMEGSTVHSPGVVANLLLMGRLAGMGVSRYDFLRGTSAFKTSLTTEQRNLVCVQAARRSLLVRFDRGVQLMRHIVRKLGRMVFRRGSPRTRS